MWITGIECSKYRGMMSAYAGRRAGLEMPIYEMRKYPGVSCVGKEENWRLVRGGTLKEQTCGVPTAQTYRVKRKRMSG